MAQPCRPPAQVRSGIRALPSGASILLHSTASRCKTVHITTEAVQGAGGGNIKVTTAPCGHGIAPKTVRISASVARRAGRRREYFDRSTVRDSRRTARFWPRRRRVRAARSQITADLFLPDANSIVNADSALRRERHRDDPVAERSDQRPDSAAGENAAARRHRCSINIAQRWPAVSSAASPWRDGTACQPNQAVGSRSPLAISCQRQRTGQGEARGTRSTGDHSPVVAPDRAGRVPDPGLRGGLVGELSIMTHRAGESAVAQH